MNILEVAILIVVLIILFKVFSMPVCNCEKRAADNNPSVVVTGPREGCEDAICKPVCDEFRRDLPRYRDCMRKCFQDKRTAIENCCSSVCGNLAGEEREQCIDSCSTPLFI